MNPADFWKPWEETANSFDDVVKFIEAIQSEWISERGLNFAWRGVVNANWALDSSLYRRLAWTRAGRKSPNERDLFEAEERILIDAHRWGLHWFDGRRLPWLFQLAMLQHYGAPTRLIDITFNAWTGVWFAVEQKWNNGDERNAQDDGRLFAIGVAAIINEDAERRPWEDMLKRPWPKPSPARTRLTSEQKAWGTTVHAWRPPPVDRRIAAQKGGFLIGGVPTTRGGNNWPKSTASDGNWWSIDEVRRSTSIAVRPHSLSPRGAVPRNPLFTLRIKADAKPEIRERLAKLYDYEHRTIYPDYPGFASFGTHWLKERP